MLSTKNNKVFRYALIPGAFAIGAITVIGFKATAGASSNAPIIPPPAVMDMQNAFEKVSDRLSPSVVFIKSNSGGGSSQTRKTQDDGSDGNDNAMSSAANTRLAASNAC